MTRSTDHEYKGLNEALEGYVGEAKHYILDSLACSLHNEGHFIAGNTEGKDSEWFAQRLYEADANFGPDRSAWDRLTDDQRAEWRKTAALCIDLLPYLMERIASRYLAAASAIRVMERAESDKWYEQKRKLQDKKYRSQNTR